MLSSDLVRSVLESAPDAMVIIDEAGVVLYANRQASEVFGYANEDIVGQPVERLMPERFRGRHVLHRRKYRKRVRIRPMGTGPELFARRKDGSEFSVEISLSPIPDSGRTLVAAAIRDVTDRVRVESELREARAAADRANRAKSRFLATASHDLRQPLQALVLLNGALRRSPSQEDVVEILGQQDQAIAVMSRLLNALLDISKLESGAVRPSLGDFEVATVFEELRREFAGQALSKGLELVVEATDARVHSDATLVAQALNNLVSNAIKYTPRGFVRLRAELRADAVRIEVQDSGIGIAPDQLEHIFEEFYQIGETARATRDGYGLGLSIVQRVVKLLGARLAVESEPGRGSSFRLELPASDTQAPSLLSRVERGARDRAAAAAARRHVLLVEDDPGVRKATQIFLVGEGYRVTTAATFEEAVSSLRDGSIELVISDYHLDGTHTGMQVIASARATLGNRVKSILVTGDTSPVMGDISLEPGLRVIRKPIEGDALLSLMRALLASELHARQPQAAAPH